MIIVTYDLRKITGCDKFPLNVYTYVYSTFTVAFWREYFSVRPIPGDFFKIRENLFSGHCSLFSDKNTDAKSKLYSDTESLLTIYLFLLPHPTLNYTFMQ